MYSGLWHIIKRMAGKKTGKKQEVLEHHKKSSKHLNLHKQIRIHISEFLFCHVTKYMADDIRSERIYTPHRIVHAGERERYSLEQKPWEMYA